MVTRTDNVLYSSFGSTIELADSNSTSVDMVSDYPSENNGGSTLTQWYDQLARMYPDTQEMQFMNYGYVDMNEDSDLSITQTSMNLYEQVSGRRSHHRYHNES